MTNFFDKNFPWNVTEHVKKFQMFLNASWPYLDDLMQHHDWHEDMDLSDDFIQVNWELLIERELLGKSRYLMPPCMRITKPRMTQVGATSTHVIIAQVNNNTYDIRSEKLIPKGTQLRFVGFLSLVEPKVLGLYPPFDIADLVTIGTKKKILNTPLTELTFFLDEISTHDLT